MSYRTLAAIICLILSVKTNAQNTSCWALSINGNDPQWPGYMNHNITSSAQLSDGFVICGTSNQAIFPSKDNNTIGRTNFGGPYVAKYDFSGNLKWLDYGIDSAYAAFQQWSTISSVTTDKNNNIYICGSNFPSKYRFYYNNGTQSVKICATDTTKEYLYYNNNFIAKLSPNGTVLWHTNLTDMPSKIAYDNNGRIVITGQLASYNCYYYKQTDTIFTFAPQYSIWSNPYYFYWVDTADGKLKKQMFIGHNGSGSVATINADSAGTLYIAGQYARKLGLFSANTTDSLIRTNIQTQNASRFYLAKIDSSGQPLWVVFDKTRNSATGSSIITVNLTRDNKIYVATDYHNTTQTDTLEFFNKDSTTIRLNKSNSYIYSISKEGFLNWHVPVGFKSMAGLAVLDTTIIIDGGNYAPVISNYDADTLYSANHIQYLTCRHLSPNIALAHYDTAGNIKKIVRIGKSNGQISYQGAWLQKLTSNSMLLYGDMKRFIGIDSVLFYNDTIKTNGYDGYFIKYTLNTCDSINIPSPVPSIAIKEPWLDTTYCQGDTFYLPITVVDSFYGINTFIARLDVPNGSYVDIGYAGGYRADSIKCVIPANSTPGNTYKIKVVTQTPGFTTKTAIHNISIGQSKPVNALINSVNGNTINDGTLVTFRSSVTNPGTNPYYQWQINSVNIPGANADTFTTNTLQNGDIITLKVHGSDACSTPDTAISNSLQMKVVSSVNMIHVPTVDIYPNPAGSYVNISGNKFRDSIVHIYLKDITGRLINTYLAETSNGHFSMSVNPGIGISKGVYILEVQDSRMSVKKKLIIE